MKVTSATRVLLRRLPAAVRTVWQELGRLGRIALLGVLLSAGIAVVLGFAIPASAEHHLLQAKTETLASVATDLVNRGLVPIDTSDPETYATLDEAVRLRLLGGDTVRVKVWSPDGTVVYSDAEGLVGRSYDLGAHAAVASAGEPLVEIAELSEPENVYERGMGDLIEFYLPVPDPKGELLGIFEVYQRAEPLLTTVGHIRRNVWLSIGTGLGVLTIFMGSLTYANARAVNRRRRQAESLLRDLLRAQEEERRRIVGSLHDDIGQPLYRLLYGLQGSRARLASDHAVVQELSRLEDLVRALDGTLRTELRMLHHDSIEELGLEPALMELVHTTRSETDLAIDVDVGPLGDLPPVARSALFRAAQEAITNARKYARADSVSIQLRREDGRVVLEVNDDGRGIQGLEGLGLATTRERLQSIGGGLVIDSHIGHGTRFRAWVLAEFTGGEA